MAKANIRQKAKIGLAKVQRSPANQRHRAKLYIKSADDEASDLGERKPILTYVRDISISIIFDGSDETSMIDGYLTRHTRKCITYLNPTDKVTTNHVIEWQDSTKWGVTDTGLDNINHRQYLTLTVYGN